MKKNLKIVAILAALVLLCAFTGCKNSTNEDDGNSISKLDAPTNLVINSITDNTTTCAVNITFNYSGKTGIDGSTKAVLGFSTTNDSSQAIYNDNINYATIESGANTRTVNFSSSELYSGTYLVPVNGKKYYFQGLRIIYFYRLFQGNLRVYHKAFVFLKLTDTLPL